jgi:hypothetical protein
MVNHSHFEIAMLRHGINDIRLFYENKARVLETNFRILKCN